MAENVASVGKRVLGAIIDIIILIIIMIIFSLLFGTSRGFSFGVSGFAALIMYLIWFAYYVVLEATTGKTIGKYIVKIKVVNASGEQISWGASIVRNILRIIDGLFFYLVGFIIALVSKENQRLGDMAAKTYVVNG
jgi:uncharacterized RDD family membrane protein YckC